MFVVHLFRFPQPQRLNGKNKATEVLNLKMNWVFLYFSLSVQRLAITDPAIISDYATGGTKNELLLDFANSVSALTQSRFMDEVQVIIWYTIKILFFRII